MNARSVTSGLLFASALLGVALLAVAFVVYNSSGYVERDGNLIRTDAVPGSIDAHILRNAVSKDIRESLLSVIATNPDSKKEHLRIVNEQHAVITNTLRHYRDTMFIDPETDRGNVERFERAFAAYATARTHLLLLDAQGKRDEALRFADDVMTPASKALAISCDTIVAYNDHNADALSANIIAESAKVRVTITITVLVALAGSILLGLNLMARRGEEREAARQSQRFSKAMSTASLAVWVRNFRDDTVEWSDTIDGIMGFGPGEFPRTISGWLDAVHADDRPLVQKAIADSEAAKKVYDVMYRLRKFDASYIWVRDAGNVLQDGVDGGKAYGAIRDITEQKIAAENTVRLEGQLRQSQKLEAIGTLAGGIAHDFNNLLTGIIGNAELASMEMEANGHMETYYEYIDTIRRAGHRAGALVKQILTFSRRGEKSVEPMALGALVGEVMKLMRSTVPANIEIVSSLEADLPLILADATQVHQVLVNLCTNSIHAMKGTNGRLAVSLESLDADIEFIELHPDLHPGLHVRMTVTDTGHGIKGDTLKRIFEPFFTTKGPGEGTGLGLSVVHGIVKEHGGGIYCYSHPGEGTAFHVYFPAIAMGWDGAAEAKKKDPPVGQGEHILVVDDEADVQRTAATMLRKLGYHVRLASDGDAALDEFRRDPESYAMVLTDLAMPNGTGLELAKSLLKIRPDLPIALMTGFAGSLTPESIRGDGLRDLIMKPLTFDSLGRAVRRVLDESVLADAGRRPPGAG